MENRIRWALRFWVLFIGQHRPVTFGSTQSEWSPLNLGQAAGTEASLFPATRLELLLNLDVYLLHQMLLHHRQKARYPTKGFTISQS